MPKCRISLHRNAVRYAMHLSKVEVRLAWDEFVTSRWYGSLLDPSDKPILAGGGRRERRRSWLMYHARVNRLRRKPSDRVATDAFTGFLDGLDGRRMSCASRYVLLVEVKDHWHHWRGIGVQKAGKMRRLSRQPCAKSPLSQVLLTSELPDVIDDGHDEDGSEGDGATVVDNGKVASDSEPGLLQDDNDVESSGEETAQQFDQFDELERVRGHFREDDEYMRVGELNQVDELDGDSQDDRLSQPDVADQLDESQTEFPYEDSISSLVDDYGSDPFHDWWHFDDWDWHELNAPINIKDGEYSDSDSENSDGDDGYSDYMSREADDEEDDSENEMEEVEDNNDHQDETNGEATAEVAKVDVGGDHENDYRRRYASHDSTSTVGYQAGSESNGSGRSRDATMAQHAAMCGVATRDGAVFRACGGSESPVENCGAKRRRFNDDNDDGCDDLAVPTKRRRLEVMVWEGKRGGVRPGRLL